MNWRWAFESFLSNYIKIKIIIKINKFTKDKNRKEKVMTFFIRFIIGFIIGGIVGFFIAALCEVAKDDKDDYDYDDDHIKFV